MAVFVGICVKNLLGAGSGTYDVLAKDYPIYGDLKEIVSDL